MRSAVISDIHGNLEALETVLRYLDREAPVDQICCLGDVVGYGADPAACLARCRVACAFLLRGNHDHVVVDPDIAEWFNPAAAAAARWTRDQLSTADRDFCATLAYREITGSATFVHATPDEPEAWHYLFTCADAGRYFDAFATPVCFVGHSHTPLVCRRGNGTMERAGVWHLDPADRTEVKRLSGQHLTPVLVHGTVVLFDSATPANGRCTMRRSASTCCS